jgi:hypothetical protein
MWPKTRRLRNGCWTSAVSRVQMKHRINSET